MAYIYTEMELSEVISKYKEGATLESLANTYNKSVASIRMKLVKQGVYVKQVKTTKAASTAAVPPNWKEGFDKEQFDNDHGDPPF